MSMTKPLRYVESMWKGIYKVPFVLKGTELDSRPLLAEKIGCESFSIKRDDCLSLALGGNKTRKLQFFIADALAQKADCVITVGGPESNHCLQTAAAAAMYDIDCHLVLGGEAPVVRGANNYEMECGHGAILHYVPKPTREKAVFNLADSLKAEGKNPYIIPLGGSNGLGALGYVEAVYELERDLSTHPHAVDTLVVCTGSGGTQAGIRLGVALAKLPVKVIAVSVDHGPEIGFEEQMLDMAKESAKLINEKCALTADDFSLEYGFHNAVYDEAKVEERYPLLRDFQKYSGVAIDSVYTKPTLACLMSLVNAGKIVKTSNVLFWHTGGKSSHLLGS